MDIHGTELKGIQNEETDNTNINIQKAKRILHFSDGVMEELSDSEDELDTSNKNTEEYINEKNLSWVPYIRLKAYKVGNNVLAGMDYVGGGLASFFGITSSELEIAATNQALHSRAENFNNEYCDTWKPLESKIVVSREIKNLSNAKI